jgi:hypothetical protein
MDVVTAGWTSRLHRGKSGLPDPIAAATNRSNVMAGSVALTQGNYDSEDDGRRGGVLERQLRTHSVAVAEAHVAPHRRLTVALTLPKNGGEINRSGCSFLDGHIIAWLGGAIASEPSQNRRHSLCAVVEWVLTGGGLAVGAANWRWAAPTLPGRERPDMVSGGSPVLAGCPVLAAQVDASISCKDTGGGRKTTAMVSGYGRPPRGGEGALTGLGGPVVCVCDSALGINGAT